MLQPRLASASLAAQQGLNIDHRVAVDFTITADGKVVCTSSQYEPSLSCRIVVSPVEQISTFSEPQSFHLLSTTADYLLLVSYHLLSSVMLTGCRAVT
jgi:hypothetical protein